MDRLRKHAKPKTMTILIVGTGMFGSVFARVMAEHGHDCLLIDRRTHIGGNCHSFEAQGVHVHRYGPHIFHTSSRSVCSFLNRFAEFNNYRHHGCVRYRGYIYSFPIKLRTLRQVWGIANREEAEAKLAEVRVPIEHPRSVQDWVVSQVGEELYEMFFRGYSTKQWGRDPNEIPAGVARRIPIRLTEDDHYFENNARYEGIPVSGYTAMFERMLDHSNIRVELGVDFLENRDYWSRQANQVVYTGKIDAFFDYEYGELAYRSLRFEHESRESAGILTAFVEISVGMLLTTISSAG